MAKTITYSATDNRIWYDGGSAVDSITPENIYNESVANGWGVGAKFDHGGNTVIYVFEAEMYGGHNATTYFKVGPGVIVFAHSWVTTANMNWNVGCESLIGDFGDNNSLNGQYTKWRGDGTFLRAVLWNTMYSRLVFDGTFTHSAIICPYVQLFSESNQIEFQDVLFSSPGDGLNFYTASAASVEGLFATAVKAEANESVFENPKVRNQLRTHHGNLILRNPDVDWRNVTIQLTDYDGITPGGDYLWVDYDVDPIIIDSSGNPIDGATVDVDRNDGIDELEFMTGADGKRPSRQLARERQYQGSTGTLTQHGPFRVTVSKAGYQTVVLEWDPNEQGELDDPITLLTWPDAPTEDEVKAGVEFFDGNVGTYTGSSYSLEATCELPTVEIEVTVPTVTVEVSNA